MRISLLLSLPRIKGKSSRPKTKKTKKTPILTQLLAQEVSVDRPRQVGHLAPVPCHGAGHGERRGPRGHERRLALERGERVGKRRVAAGRVDHLQDLLAVRVRRPVFSFSHAREDEAGVGAADVGDEDDVGVGLGEFLSFFGEERKVSFVEVEEKTEAWKRGIDSLNLFFSLSLSLSLPTHVALPPAVGRGSDGGGSCRDGV